MKISACIITKNEEKNIPACLQSLQNIVDEIIVVDTGSTDQTVCLAKQYKAKVFCFDWKNDFAAAKNFAIDQARGEWIIFLDADEYFFEKSIPLLPALIKKHANECDAYLVKIINIDVDHNNKYLDDFFAMRIFRNSKQLRFRGKVHEELSFSNGKRKALYQLDGEDIKLYHTGYSEQRIKEKCQRNLSILLAELAENPKNINLYRYLADVYNGLEDYPNAIKYAKMDIATGKKEISYASRSYRVINNSLMKMKADPQEVEYYLKKAMEAFPKLPDFYAEYALMKYNQQDYEAAFDFMTKAMELSKIYHEMETTLFDKKLPTTYLLFGLLYERRNELPQAIDFYQKSLLADKYYPEAFLALFKLIQNEEAKYVIAFLNTIYNRKIAADVEFLIKQIGMVNKGEIYLYYHNADKFSNIITEQKEEMQDLLLSVILLNDKNTMQEIESRLPQSYKTILNCYFQIEKVEFTAIDFGLYADILLRLLLMDESECLAQYLELSKGFEQKRLLQLATILQERSFFKQALNLYEFMLENYKTDCTAQLYYETGFCAYQIKAYNKAIPYFEEALKNGYQGHDLKEFLNWSVERL